MILRKYYPTIVLSDIHLGSEHSRTEEVTRFLKHVDCDRLILNGDLRIFPRHRHGAEFRRLDDIVENEFAFGDGSQSRNVGDLIEDECTILNGYAVEAC